jgi:hypothetical protein
LAGQPSALPRAAGSTTAREFLPGGEMLEVLDPAASLLLELLPAAALAALAACAPEPAAGWACADLARRLGAPLADLEALVAAVVAAGGGGALPALFELPRAACQAIAAAAGAGALRVVSPKTSKCCNTVLRRVTL